MEYYAATKKRQETLLYTITGMNLKDIMLSKTKLIMTPLIWSTISSQNHENRKGSYQGLGGGDTRN